MALFVDDKASVQAVKALTWIMTGRAGGSTASAENPRRQFLGVRQVPISYETQGETRIVKIEKIVDGAITPVRGKDQGNVVIRNSEYWIAPDIIVVARRQVALPRCSAATGISRAARPKSASSTGATSRRSRRRGVMRSGNCCVRALRFPVHVFTACGAALALLALIAATRGDWAAMFFWLGLALVVDGIDGPLARAFKVAEVLPRWSGDTLDLVVDFTTYVFVPAYAIAASGLLPRAAGDSGRRRRSWSPARSISPTAT